MVLASGMAEELKVVREFVDRMPIHHKALEKRRIKRKNPPAKEGRSLVRSKTYTTIKRGNSKSDVLVDVRPTTPSYLKDVFDYDKSSSSEENTSEDEKDKRQQKPLDISQKVYIAACEREGIPPRQRLVTRLAEEALDAKDFLLTPDDIRALACALTTNTCVTTLDLSGNTVGRLGMESIVDMLEENTSITDIKLSNSKIGLYEVMLLTEMLSENLNITTLECAGNNLDDECAKCFAEALKFNRKLKTLNLSSNSFQENGGICLARIMESNDSIQDLDISWNHIRLGGALAWGETLYRNEELRHLNLAWNGFCDEGAVALGESLMDNDTLYTLNLTSNRIGYDGCKAFARALKVNKTLQRLELSQNPVSTQGVIELLDAINQNETSKVDFLILEGIQVTHEAEDLSEEIRENHADFSLVHSGFVISPDTLTARPPIEPEKKCRSSKS